MSCVSNERLLAITVRRAQVLSALLDTRLELEAAQRLGLSYNGLRSHVEDLKRLAGRRSVADLREFWGEHAGEWREALARAAGGG